VFLCQTSDQRGQVYTPNIPDSFFDHERVASSGPGGTLDEARDGFTYFFTLPPESPQRNCSGNVQAVQFCYRAELRNGELGIQQDVFEFLITTREDFLFTITDRFTVSDISTSSNCVVGVRRMGRTPHDCCTTITPPTQLQIPSGSSSSYTFGVRIIDSDIRPYAFSNFAEEFHAEQFQTTANGDAFTLGSGNQVTDNAILLLRFLLGTNVTRRNGITNSGSWPWCIKNACIQN
jgi:hypothetical protein